MLRTPQYTKDQRVFMVNRRGKGDTYKIINYDFKKAFPLAGRDPSKMTISRNKKKFDKEGLLYINFPVSHMKKYFLI